MKLAQTPQHYEKSRRGPKVERLAIEETGGKFRKERRAKRKPCAPGKRLRTRTMPMTPE